MRFTERALQRALALTALIFLLVSPGLALRASAHELEGRASWYGGKFQGRLTASGEVFDTTRLTAAHKTLPFGTIVEVTNLDNGRTVQVRINDRGPFVEGRIIDLSRAAADALDMAGQGVARVSLRIISEPGVALRTIQVGSFSVRANAESVVARIRRAGLAAAIETGLTGSTVFRVVLADIPEPEVAATVARLRAIGYDAVLVRSR